MSKSIIGDHSWAGMTEGQKIEAVQRGHATLKQLSEGLLDGSERLRDSCREFLADTDPSFENLPVNPEQRNASNESITWPNTVVPQQRATKVTGRASDQVFKPRFGLPEGFVPRLQRYGRSVLLELNIYQLPNGQEFIPCHPSGTLGTHRHLYALLTNEQYLDGKRGSVYIRTDGRIFDYSVDSANPSGDLFDTGYTIYDLERTGRYAPELRPRKKRKKKKKKKKSRQLKYRQAAAAN
ncbi:MAG TPA: hypothetical protein VIF64_01385 [Pyrinomonadaceae bacterium]|jgi:hypothetical protein